MTDLDTDLGADVLMNEVGNPAPSLDMVVPVEPGAPRRDASGLRHPGAFRDDVTRAAHRPRAVVHHVPIGGAPVDRRVHVHGRDHDPVCERKTPQFVRLEHRRCDIGLGQSSLGHACLLEPVGAQPYTIFCARPVFADS